MFIQALSADFGRKSQSNGRGPGPGPGGGQRTGSRASSYGAGAATGARLAVAAPSSPATTPLQLGPDLPIAPPPQRSSARQHQQATANTKTAYQTNSTTSRALSPAPASSRARPEVFFLHLEDGYFGCQVNESIDVLQLYDVSKLCDGIPDCFLGSDENRAKLKCSGTSFDFVLV